LDLALSHLIFLAGFGQLAVLMASALVPFRLNWREELRCLKPLHRQMYWVYGGYVVLSIVAFAAISIFNASELANGTGLTRGFCAYVSVFWGVRVVLQAFFHVKEHLTAWWLKIGYVVLGLLFMSLTIIYAWAALHSGITPRG
jgi:hypothetical protein